MASRRLTGWRAARLAAMRTRFLPPDAAGDAVEDGDDGVPVDRCHGVPPLMQVAVSLMVKSRGGGRAVAMIRPAAASVEGDALGRGRSVSELAGHRLLVRGAVSSWPHGSARRLQAMRAYWLAGRSEMPNIRIRCSGSGLPVSASCRIRSRRMRSTLTPWDLRWKLT